MSNTMRLYCPACRADTEFEQPPCVDGHEGDCPDLVCVVCGLAMFAFVSDDLAYGEQTQVQTARRLRSKVA